MREEISYNFWFLSRGLKYTQPNHTYEYGCYCIPPGFSLFCSDLGVMQYWLCLQTSFNYEIDFKSLTVDS